jgi:hypothetical protein
MVVDPSAGDLATVARWVEALDSGKTSDGLVIEIIRKDRSGPNPKRVSFLNYFTSRIMRELERGIAARVAEAATTAVPVAAAVVSAAPPPASKTTRPGPSAPNGLVIKALAWANIAKQPDRKEIGTVGRWVQLGATAELIQAVIVDTLARATKSKSQPRTLQYFDHEIREALNARSPHGSFPMPAARLEPLEPVDLAANAMTTAASITSTAVSAAPPPVPETARPGPSTPNGLAIRALAWANIAGRRPTPTEIGMVWGWVQRGATAELIQAVIEFILTRATKSQPATLHYFDQAIHEALDARSSHGSPPMPAASTPVSPDRKPSSEGEPKARIFEGACPPPPPADDFLTAARVVYSPAATSLNRPDSGPRNRPESGPESSAVGHRCYCSSGGIISSRPGCRTRARPV